MLRRSHNNRIDPALAVFNPPEQRQNFDPKDYSYLVPDFIRFIRTTGAPDVTLYYKNKNEADRLAAHLQTLHLPAPRVSKSKNPQTSEYFYIELTEDQFDYWLGFDSYKQLKQVYSLLNVDDGEIDKFNNNFLAWLNKQIEQTNAVLLNLAMLIYDDGWDNDDRWLICTHLIYSLPDDLVIKCLDRLNPVVCNKAALFKDAVGWTLITTAADRQSLEAFNALLDKLSAETITQLLPMKLNDGPNTLEAIARYGQDEKFIAFIDRLGGEACARAALMLNGDNSALEKIRSYVSEAAWFRLLNKIYHDPQQVRKIAGSINHLSAIQFHDGGASSDAWSWITAMIIEKAPAPRKRKADDDLSTAMQGYKVRRPAWKPDFLNSLKRYGIKFLRVQGRTILLQDREGMILAVKIQKKDETREELAKEFDTTTYLRQHAEELKLQSSLPEPLSITQVSRVLTWLAPHVSPEAYQKFSAMTGGSDNRVAYIYKVNPEHCNYFTYLHDANLSEEEFQRANAMAVHDLYTMFAHGIIFPQLADLFHNSEHVDDRDDKGRYLVLVNLLRTHSGSGRLTGWKEAVEYPNVRASGLADLGDRVSINEYIGHTERVEKFHNRTWWDHREKTGNYLFANLMAEYQYALFLIAGRRAGDLTEQAKVKGASEETVRTIWKNAALQVLRNCAQAVSILSTQTIESAEAFLRGVVDVNRLARQMQYWMTDAYIEDVKNNKLPEDIYGEGTEISLDFSRFRDGTFNDRIGCSIDGVHQDLGPVNGQEPIKEANKLFYWMVSSIFTSYHQVRMTTADLLKVTRNWIKPPREQRAHEENRRKLFAHLPEKEYHAMQRTLCREKLKWSLPGRLRSELRKEAAEHERKHAAITIYHFWKTNKLKREFSRLESREAEPAAKKRKR